MERQGQKIIFIVILAVVIVAGSFYGFWQKRSVVESTSSGEALGKNTKVTEEKKSEIVVYISGAVNKPGVFKLPNDARVVDLVVLAGGLSYEADPAQINMAQLVKDGMHIHVATRTVLSAGGEMPIMTSKAKSGAKVNINRADKTEFDSLPGVGPALAQQIVEYRQANGGFSDLEGLRKVPGIGVSKFEKLKDKITL